MKRGLIVSLAHPKSRYEAQRVAEEARGIGLAFDWFEYEGLIVEFNLGKSWFTYKGRQVEAEDYQWAYFRPSHYGGYGDYSDLKTLLLQRLQEAKVRVANINSLIKWPHFSKLRQSALFTENKIPIIHAWQIARLDAGQLAGYYPLIVKKTLSSMGVDVFRVMNEKELNQVVSRYSWGKLLIQEYVPIKEDYRVMVVNGRAIGMMGRRLAPHSHLTNISAGGTARKMALTAEFARLAQEVARVCDLDHCGVDILRDEGGQLKMIEVNRHPQFQGFEKITGINVAKKLVEYLAG